jgi:hypothetical protein
VLKRFRAICVVRYPPDQRSRIRPLAALTLIASALWLAIPAIERQLHNRKIDCRLNALTGDEKLVPDGDHQRSMNA